MSAPILQTTVVGSYPKPLWLSNPYGILFGGWRLRAEVLREGQDDATLLAIRDQERGQIDVISDGEQRRDNFIFYFTRKLSGFDFENPARRELGGSRREINVPRVVGPVGREQSLATADVRFLRANTDRKIKAAIAGPMTIMDTSEDVHYRGDKRALSMDLAIAINAEIRDWVREGCDVVQIDEPAFTRYPAAVREWGIAALDRCLEGIRARTVVHICYGYPVDGTRVRQHGYEELLPSLADSRVDYVSLECAAPTLDPSLLKLCEGKEVIFGVIDIGLHQVERPGDISKRILSALAYVSPERLWPGPDCGLVLLDRTLARAKLSALAEGVRIARAEVTGSRADTLRNVAER
jgi:5-methyltetrahydropteroyltriglutamate--homocysteine methyltransferase